MFLPKPAFGLNTNDDEDVIYSPEKPGLYIIILNVHAPSEKKNYDSKDSFYEKLEQIFGHFPKNDMKSLLGNSSSSPSSSFSSSMD